MHMVAQTKCGDDAAFRNRILELLKAAETAGDFLRESELEETVQEPPGTRQEDQNGRYKLLMIGNWFLRGRLD